jgi:RNA-directed DNA polymerase
MGTSQGGVVSPLLCNIALHGIEKHLNQWISGITFKDSKGRFFSKRSKISSLTIVRYADDLVILHKHLWVVESAKNELNLWLKDLGLELNPDKTRIGHTTKPISGVVGFDFLGFNLRKYPVGSYHRGKLRLPALCPTLSLQSRASKQARTLLEEPLFPLETGFFEDLRP